MTLSNLNENNRVLTNTKSRFVLVFLGCVLGPLCLAGLADDQNPLQGTKTRQFWEEWKRMFHCIGVMDLPELIFFPSGPPNLIAFILPDC